METTEIRIVLAKGRDYRSEFHINPSDELMYQIKGAVNLHYRRVEGKENVAVLKEGSVIHMPAGTPYSPGFPSDTFALIVGGRKRGLSVVPRTGKLNAVMCELFYRGAMPGAVY